MSHVHACPAAPSPHLGEAEPWHRGVWICPKRLYTEWRTTDVCTIVQCKINLRQTLAILVGRELASNLSSPCLTKFDKYVEKKKGGWSLWSGRRSDFAVWLVLFWLAKWFDLNSTMRPSSPRSVWSLEVRFFAKKSKMLNEVLCRCFVNCLSSPNMVQFSGSNDCDSSQLTL